MIKLVAGGDLMLGEHPAMVGRGVGTRIRSNADYNPLSALVPLFSTADVVFANLESVISDAPRFSPPSRRECRAPSGALNVISECGINALSVANNHIQQYGDALFNETIGILRDKGILVIGLAHSSRAGSCEPADITIRNICLRFLGYSLRPRQHFTHAPLYAEGTPDGIVADIREAVAAGTIPIVSIHWGDEFISIPSPQQRALAQLICESGCALLIGHHPHVLQPWEQRAGCAILYSLGNFVFDMMWQPELRRSAIATCFISHDSPVSIDFTALSMDADFRTYPATGTIEREILTTLNSIQSGDLSHLLNDYSAYNSFYNSTLRTASRTERWARNRYFLRNIHRYNFDVAFELIMKFLLRRVGMLRD